MISLHLPNELKRKSGIYMIVCLANGKVYIGSAKDLWKRFYKHKKMLRDNKHPARYMQNSWNLYGENAFTFQIIELCEKTNLLEREQNWLDRYKPYDRELGFNTNIKAHSREGTKNSQESKDNLSKVWTKLTGIDYELMSPDGQIFKGRGLSQFAKKHGLDKTHLSKVIRGTAIHSKGWRLPTTKTVKWFIPKGTVCRFFDVFKQSYEVPFENLSSFAAQHGLTESRLSDVWANRIRHHKGWHRFDVDSSAYVDFVSPSGEIVSVSITGQRYFSRKYNLNESGVNSVINGNQKTVSGWTLKSNASKVIGRYRIIDPKGEELTFNCDNRSLSRFCEERGLNKKHFSSLARAERKTYAGYINPNYISNRLRMKMKLLAA